MYGEDHFFAIYVVHIQEAMESSASPNYPLTFAAAPTDTVVAGWASNQLHVTAELFGLSERYSSKALVRQK